MLEKLFGSNTRVKLLKLFLNNPERKFYVRQIGRLLRLQINSVRRELDNLEIFGLLTSSMSKEENSNNNQIIVGGEAPAINKSSLIAKEDENSIITRQEKKYYQVNKNFALFDEIKNLIVRAQILYKDDLIKKILKAGKIKLLILTGVFVNLLDSQIDILIVGKIDREKLKKIIKELEKELGKEVNYTIMDSREFRYRRDMTDVFLYNLLESKKLVAIDEIGLSS